MVTKYWVTGFSRDLKWWDRWPLSFDIIVVAVVDLLSLLAALELTTIESHKRVLSTPTLTTMETSFVKVSIQNFSFPFWQKIRVILTPTATFYIFPIAGWCRFWLSLMVSFLQNKLSDFCGISFCIRIISSYVVAKTLLCDNAAMCFILAKSNFISLLLLLRKVCKIEVIRILIQSCFSIPIKCPLLLV